MRTWGGVILVLVATAACAVNIHRPYQTLALSRGLEHDGFLVGIEVRHRAEVGVAFQGADPARLREPIGPGRGGARHRLFRRVMTGDRILFVSHVYEMHGSGTGTHVSHTLYNAYDPGERPGDTDGVFDDRRLDYEEGYRALDGLAERLEAVVRATCATHVLFLSMGWHNDQIECLGRYNLLLRELKAAAAAEPSRAFRPVVVGLTWPSAWFEGSPLRLVNKAGHYLSYFQKVEDADELGFGVANHLLHRVILRVKGRPGLGHLRTVLIGHSMGARVLAQALYGREYLIPPTPSPCADLYLGLQPAMDAYRFVPGKGAEGTPYAHDPGAWVVMTSSQHDRANTKAAWSRHLGGRAGWRAAGQHPKIFRRVVWAPGPSCALRPTSDSTAVLVDASSIVRGAPSGVYPTKLDAHNDVLDREMATLIWHCIRHVDP